MAGRYDKRDYIFNGTLAVATIVIWLRATVQEPSETALALIWRSLGAYHGPTLGFSILP